MVKTQDVTAFVGEEEQEEQKQRLMSRAQSCILIVDNIPQVGTDKVDKLKGVLAKIFRGIGPLAPVIEGSDEGVFVPMDQTTQMAKGFAFVRYAKPADAQTALVHTNGYQLDKSHAFVTCLLADIERVQAAPDVFEEPKRSENHVESAEDVVDTTSWLIDARGREQFCIRHKDETEIYWQDSVVPPEVDYARQHWTESKVMWSPKGSFLATFHRQGIALWGGPEWQKIVRFPHKNVKHAQFSPCEKYMITHNGLEIERDDAKEPQSIAVWEISTGRFLRGFLGVPSGEEAPWPLYKWSHDDSMFARMAPGVISVYSTSDMTLLGKKSLKIPDVQTFEWSPTSNLMAYWTPSQGEGPARVSLIDLPSKNEIRNKALFSVSDMKLIWHPQGTYMCCSASRLTKNKKGKFTSFELFRIQMKDIPIESMEFKETETVSNFCWEPNGDRFAMMHQENTPGRHHVSFYTMEGPQASVKKLFQLNTRTVSHMFWSPLGNTIVLAGLGTMNGQLEWVNVTDQATSSSGEHFMATDVTWDPSGRYVATAVSSQRTSLESGYMIWNAIGKELFSAVHDSFYQLMWRPRPPLALSAEQIKEVKKNLKEYRERYEKEDHELKESRRSGKAARLRQLREEWSKIYSQLLVIYDAERAKRSAARGGVPDYDAAVEKTGSEPGYVVIEQVVEHILEIKQDVDYERGKLLNSEDERD